MENLELENKIEIKASQDRVWKVTIDVEAWPEWAPAMQKIIKEDSGDFKLGSSALIKQKQLPETRWTVTKINPRHSFSWQTKVIGIEMTASHFIIPSDNAVISILRVDMNGWIIKLLRPLIKILILSSLKKENLGLKNYCES